ncbi:MAG: hypothetical protein WA085_07710 [Sphingobium sp.]|uniref:hypothetical protein n=1 Tax=Sphingobium sp. CECT 9361 TaxID=2845384 RepID=UPI001E536C7D|nr:hypothetical protein [Sphingobium sp. CECT 9361]
MGVTIVAHHLRTSIFWQDRNFPDADRLIALNGPQTRASLFWMQNCHLAVLGDAYPSTTMTFA